MKNEKCRMKNYWGIGMKDNAIVDKSKAFAIRIIKLYQYLTSEKQEYTLSKQALRSGTSIGANVRESLRAQSKADFIVKQNIALKEADEVVIGLNFYMKPILYG